MKNFFEIYPFYIMVLKFSVKMDVMYNVIKLHNIKAQYKQKINEEEEDVGDDDQKE